MTDANNRTIRVGNAITDILDKIYDAVLQGAPALHIDSAELLAANYVSAKSSAREQGESLARWQVGKAGVTGFAAGLGGLLTLPAALPANLASVLFIQLRMVVAIAIIGGHDPKDDRVKIAALGCLVGGSANQLAREFGIKLANKLAEKAVQRIPGQVLFEINKKVGFRLATKFGEKGLINLGKAIPLVGGFVGGAFDAGSTYGIGKVAIQLFVDDDVTTPE